VCAYRDVELKAERRPCNKTYTRMVRVWKPNCRGPASWCLGYQRRSQYSQLTSSDALSRTIHTQSHQQILGLPLIIIFTRDSIYAIARICHANSVCPSATRVYCVKTAERIIEILSPSDRPNVLVFRHQRSLRKSDGFTPNGGAKYKGGSKN